MTFTLADGTACELEGSVLEKGHSIAAAGRPVVQMTQKWVAGRGG